MLFEDVFLVISCVQAKRERQSSVLSRADILINKERTEELVRERTAELEARGQERDADIRQELAAMRAETSWTGHLNAT